MFRVKENPDGSYSVYSNDTRNEFICNVASRSRVPISSKVSDSPARNLRRKRQIVPLTPTRLQLSPTSSKRKPPFVKEAKTDWSSCPGAYKYDDDNNYDTSSVTSYESSVSSKFSCASIESSTEPDEECIDKASFCRMLDLIESKHLLGYTDYQEILQSFPVRKIRQNWRQGVRRRFGKRTEYISFSSLLGTNILKDDPRSKLSETVEHLTLKYDRFCKVSVTSVKTSDDNAPSLRTREAKGKYPVTFKRTSNYVHEYTFNKKQKRRHAEYLKSGLSHRSFLLKLKCRRCSVPLKRLSPATISRFCNPPIRRQTRSLQKSQDTATGKGACQAKLPNGISHFKPVVCLGPQSVIKKLLRKFGLA